MAHGVDDIMSNRHDLTRLLDRLPRDLAMHHLLKRQIYTTVQLSHLHLSSNQSKDTKWRT